MVPSQSSSPPRSQNLEFDLSLNFLLQLAATSPPRTSTVIHISLESSSTLASGSSPQGDVFSDSLSFSHNAALRERAGIQAVVFGRLESNSEGVPPSLALVLGRKVMDKKKDGRGGKVKPRPDDPLPRGKQ